MTTKTAPIHLNYFKQGDDLRIALEATKTPDEALRLHASQMLQVSNHLRNLANQISSYEFIEVPPGTIKLHADVHHIEIKGPEDLIDSLIKDGLAHLDPLAEFAKDIVAAAESPLPTAPTEDRESEEAVDYREVDRENLKSILERHIFIYNPSCSGFKDQESLDAAMWKMFDGLYEAGWRCNISIQKGYNLCIYGTTFARTDKTEGRQKLYTSEFGSDILSGENLIYRGISMVWDAIFKQKTHMIATGALNRKWMIR